MTEVTYYFNSYDAGEAWANDPELMVDGIITNKASTTVDTQVQLCNGNTATSTDIGQILKVEIRHLGNRDGGGSAKINNRPVYTAGDGEINEFSVPTGSMGYSSYVDITTDTNAPNPWTWPDVDSLNCDIIYDQTGTPTTVYCPKIELKVTYMPILTETITALASFARYQDLSEIVTVTDICLPIFQFLTNLLDYSEEINNLYRVSLKVNADMKESLVSALDYAGRVSVFHRPFGETEITDSTTNLKNIINLKFIHPASGIGEQLTLIVKDFSTVIHPGIPWYTFNISGYNYHPKEANGMIDYVSTSIEALGLNYNHYITIKNTGLINHNADNVSVTINGTWQSTSTFSGSLLAGESCQILVGNLPGDGAKTAWITTPTGEHCVGSYTI